jgi:hypothetical protein
MHREVVGDQDQRQPELAPQPLEQLEDLGLDHHVERRRRLVADHDRGSQASAIAIIARWRMPPDSSWGYAPYRFFGIPTSSSSSAARFGDASRDWLSRTSIGSAIWSPTGDRVEGVHRPLEHDRDLPPAIARELALVLRHEVDAEQLDLARPDPPFGGSRRTSDSAVVVFPQPDSPAIPSASPSSSRKLTPSTAFTLPSASRSGRRGPPRRAAALRHGLFRQRPLAASADRGGSGNAGAGGWVEDGLGHRRSMPSVQDVVEGVAEERERQHHEDHRGGRRDDVPPRAEARGAGRLGVVQDLAPRRRGGVAQTDEREGRLGEDGRREGEDRLATIRFTTFGRLWRRMIRPGPEPMTRARSTNIRSCSDSTCCG